jgi:hypothetical protein
VHSFANFKLLGFSYVHGTRPFISLSVGLLMQVRVANSNLLHTAKRGRFFGQIGCHTAKHENQLFHNEDDIQNLITQLKTAETVGEGLIPYP